MHNDTELILIQHPNSFSFLQQTAECKCKENVEGECCNTCVDGTFDLQANNPDGCTDCICSGKTTFCKSHNHLVRSTVSYYVK